MHIRATHPITSLALFIVLLLRPALYSAEEVDQPNQSAFRGNFAARQVLAAYKLAYPERIQRIAIFDGEWAMRLDDRWYYWADGRLLPEDLRDRKEQYSPYPFYDYAETPYPPPPAISSEDRARLTAMLKERSRYPLQRHPGFYNDLYRIHNKDESWAQVKTTYFLGMKTQMHRDLLEDLAAVEEELQAKMKTDGELRDFVERLWGVEAYNWRFIAGTGTLSFHSYGAAVDLLPYSYNGKHVYWLWSQDRIEEWFTIKWEDRFRPPESFIRAFERQGFIWGGKWFFFDTIHFEYRPEILILNGILPK